MKFTQTVFLKNHTIFTIRCQLNKTEWSLGFLNLVSDLKYVIGFVYKTLILTSEILLWKGIEKGISLLEAWFKHINGKQICLLFIFWLLNFYHDYFCTLWTFQKNQSQLNGSVPERVKRPTPLKFEWSTLWNENLRDFNSDFVDS